MVKCFNITSFVMVAIVTVSALHANYCTRRSYFLSPLTIGMASFRKSGISRVIATRARYICFPTLFRACRCFCIMCNLIMSESRDFFICCVIAISTCYKCFPTNCCTCRCLGCVCKFGVSEGGNLFVCCVIAL